MRWLAFTLLGLNIVLLVPLRVAQAHQESSLKCVEAIHQAIYNELDSSEVARLCEIPPTMSGILAMNYDISLGIAERRSALQRQLSTKEWERCRSEGLHFYEDLNKEVRIKGTSERLDEGILSDFIFSVLYEGAVTGAGQMHFFANVQEPDFCLDPFLVASVLRVRMAYMAVSKNLLDAMARGELSHNAAYAVWLAVLHADNAPQFQHKGAKVFLAAARDGRFSGQRAGNLVDRLAVAEGRPLVYGILYDCADGRLVPPEIIDIDQLDMRRAEIGLIPYADYLSQEAEQCR